MAGKRSVPSGNDAIDPDAVSVGSVEASTALSIASDTSPVSPLSPFSPLRLWKAKAKFFAVSAPLAVTSTDGVPTVLSTDALTVPKPAAAPVLPVSPLSPLSPLSPFSPVICFLLSHVTTDEFTALTR